MSINRYKPHIYILPEDDAYKDIANGFILASNINDRVIQVLPVARGWSKASDALNKKRLGLASEMRKYSDTMMMVLLIDFDQNQLSQSKHEERLNFVRSQFPDDLKERVFILGILSEPEGLKKDIRYSLSREKMGESLAKGCPDKQSELWEHELLKHNKPELDRLIEKVKAFLFI